MDEQHAARGEIRRTLGWTPWRPRSVAVPVPQPRHDTLSPIDYEIRCFSQNRARFGPYNHLSNLPNSAAVFRTLASFKSLACCG